MVFRTVVAPQDVDAVRDLVARAGVFSPEEISVAAELVEEALIKGEEKSGYSFVFAEENENILGYACFGRVPMTQASYDLYWIVVDRGAQGKGLAKALLTRSEGHIGFSAPPLARLYAETSSGPLYAPARAFYIGSGFELAATFKDFYKTGDDKLVFVKNVQERD